MLIDIIVLETLLTTRLGLFGCFAAQWLFFPPREVYVLGKLSTNILVCEAISRNRFNFIMKNIRCCNNADLLLNDKFAKLRPLFDILNKKKIIDMSPCEELHSIDEYLPYLGIMV